MYAAAPPGTRQAKHIHKTKTPRTENSLSTKTKLQVGLEAVAAVCSSVDKFRLLVGLAHATLPAVSFWPSSTIFPTRPVLLPPRDASGMRDPPSPSCSPPPVV